MIKKLESSSDEIVVLEAIKEISSDDYTNVLIPEMQKLIDSKGEIRCVVIFDETFTNFTLGAMVQDGLFGIKNISEFKRVSIVGLHSWMEELVKLAEFMAPDIVKRFNPDEMDKALSWAKS
jgi:hypothetical protein